MDLGNSSLHRDRMNRMAVDVFRMALSRLAVSLVISEKGFWIDRAVIGDVSGP